MIQQKNVLRRDLIRNENQMKKKYVELVFFYHWVPILGVWQVTFDNNP